MTKRLLVIPDLCTGCSRCVYACSAKLEGVFRPSQACIHITNFAIQGYSVPNICFQCPNAACLSACPEGAIGRNDGGVVVVNEEECTGCGSCVSACPYGMIEQNDSGLARKCDYCGGDPTCVKECLPGALVFREPDRDLLKMRSLQRKQRFNKGSPEVKRYRLGAAVAGLARHFGRGGALEHG